MRLQGKRAIVTGGAGALGRVISEALAVEGADVAVLDLNAEGAAKVAAGLDGVRALGIAADLTDFVAVQDAVGQVIREWGGVDILVNAAEAARSPSSTR